MKQKRAMHEGIINKVRQERSQNHQVEEEVLSETTLSKGKGKKVSGSKRKATTFKDDKFFISAVPKNQLLEAGLSMRANEGFESSDRLEAAVLDLAADDAGGLQKQKTRYHWDKRSKKYIKLNNGDRVTASGKIKTESGAIVKSNKTGDIYKKWKAKSHSKVSLRGTGGDDNSESDSNFAGGNNFRGDNRRFKGGSGSRAFRNKNSRPSKQRSTEKGDQSFTDERKIEGQKG